MKILKYIHSIILTVFIACQFMSCNDDNFLEEHPDTIYTIDNVYSSSEQVGQIVVGIYAQIRDLKTNPVSDAAWMLDFKGRGTDMYDIAFDRKSQSFSDYGIINTNHNTFYQVYTAYYEIIAKANLALYASELPQITWASAGDKAYVVAQARFFRAFAYKNLAELFGGVPLVTEIATTARYDYNRETRTATYQYAIDEMEAVLNDIPLATATNGRIVRGAVQHNLSELYLALGTQLAADGKAGEAQNAFTSSINYANSVIDGGAYSLINTRFGTRKNEETIHYDIHQNGIETGAVVDTIQMEANYYWDLFQEGNVDFQDGNTECIWAVEIDYAAYKKEDTRSYLPYTRQYGPNFREGSARFFGACLLEEVGGRNVYISCITPYVRDEIYSGKFAGDMRNSDVVFRRRLKANQVSSPYYKQLVPWELIYNDPAKTDAENKNYQSQQYPISCKISTDKFTGLADGQNRSNLFRDDYMIRLSETILLRAEAKQRSGDKAGAAADVNLLRTRAQCAYLVTVADMDDNFDLILDERARELVYEEYRWNTLLRMGGTV
ncbi:MAG: RagB/SusD family nutrient uptake outer membrane protein, partial [Tannerella sp.]|nr:RagB/SusD family nutrient uptake outer membrane protein [Tannerella sp.]